MVSALDDEFMVSEETLICAYRYALTHQTYGVRSVIRDICENADLLSAKARNQIIKELREHWSANTLGNSSDRAEWVKLLELLEEIESEDQ